jgi:hypothetical protein
MPEPFIIEYCYTFQSGEIRRFAMALDRETLALQIDKRPDAPPWTLLNHTKCEICPLDEKDHPRCPVALNVADIVEQFKDMVSYENVDVVVTTEDRTYSKATTLQQGLSPLISIIMSTSGCPIMDQLKPMVRFHLPFASLIESVFRMASMHLMEQYFQKQDGRSPDWTLDGLAKIYAQMGIVNRDFALRLQDVEKKDANLHALVNLDCVAQMVPMDAEDVLREIKPFFSAYL